MIGIPPWRPVALAGVVVALLVGLCASAPAQEAPPNPPVPAVVSNFLAADATELGVITLYFFGAEGAPVNFYERVGDALVSLGTKTAPAGDPTALKRAVSWDCDRLERSFAATADLPNGTVALGAYSVRTPSCGTRFELLVPRLVEPGKTGRIRIKDRWGNGDIAVQLCVRRPESKYGCETVEFGEAVSIKTRRFRADKRGRWRVRLRTRGHQLDASTQVGGDASSLPDPPPKLLATGDSTMQGIDSFLADELGNSATVQSDVRPGSGISKSEGWLRLSRAQARREKPKVTVITIGAADGASMPTPAGVLAECCDEQWTTEYARRVKIVMRNYAREGKGHVFWLTLPKPRGETFVTDAINSAILRAAKGMKDVDILRNDLLFTPDGYADVVNYHGRDVRVREDDGIHLNVAGTSIAAKAIAGAIRETRALKTKSE